MASLAREVRMRLDARGFTVLNVEHDLDEGSIGIRAVNSADPVVGVKFSCPPDWPVNDLVDRLVESFIDEADRRKGGDPR